MNRQLPLERLAALLLGVAALVAPFGAQAGSRTESTTRTIVKNDDDGGDFAYVLAKPDQNWTSGGGESADFSQAQRLAKQQRKPVLFVRDGDERFLITDPATIAEVEDYMEPQMLLGRQQGMLGRQQSRLGKEQSRLGRQQGLLGARQGRLGARTAELTGMIVQAAANERPTGAFERELESVSREMSALGREQSELGKHQAYLGEEQGKLGEEQGRMGEQQARLSREIAKKIEQLVSNPRVRDRAIRIG